MLELSNLISSLNVSKDLVGREKQALLNRVGIKMADKVKQHTPVDTGGLRDSIHHEVNSNDTVSISSDIEYAPYVDKGHASGDRFVAGHHMFDKAMLQADIVMDTEAQSFVSKIKLLG